VTDAQTDRHMTTQHIPALAYNCLSWYKFVNTHLYHSRQLYNIQIFVY